MCTVALRRVLRDIHNALNIYIYIIENTLLDKCGEMLVGWCTYEYSVCIRLWQFSASHLCILTLNNENNTLSTRISTACTFKAFKSKWILMCLYLTSLLLLLFYFIFCLTTFVHLLLCVCVLRCSPATNMTHLQNCQRIHLYYHTVNVLFVFRCMCVSQLNCVFQHFSWYGSVVKLSS